jgi:predicted AAA+ superfamily ATPase
VKPGDVIQQITSFNPWWQDDSWERRDVQLRAATSSGLNYAPAVLADIPEGSLVLLRGPRRVGKSVALKRSVVEAIGSGVPRRSIIHAAVDGWRAGDLRTLVETGKRLAPPGTSRRWWLLDEIGTVEGWAPVIKSLRDNDPEVAEDTVILTSSSAADLTAATSLLAGRRGPVSRPDRTLLPMGFRTFFDLVVVARGQSAPAVPHLEPAELRSPRATAAFNELIPWSNDLIAYWEIYLSFGGFPQAVAAYLRGGTIEPLTQALFDVIQRDVFGTSAITERQTLSLLARVRENLCSPLNSTTLAQDLGVSTDTLTRRLDDLARAYLLWPCPQSDQLAPRLRARSKWYFTDPLLARLAHLRNPIHPAPDLTQLTEMELGNVLQRNLEASWPGRYAGFDQVLFERTPTRKEIDFVGPALDPVAIEAKYTDSGRWVAEAASLNSSPHLGVVATRSVLDTAATSAERSWAVPASYLAYCLDT